MGAPVMICHLAECLMDRALDCRWDATASEKMFKHAAVREGVMRMGYVGELRPLRFLSETVIVVIRSLRLHARLFTSSCSTRITLVFRELAVPPAFPRRSRRPFVPAVRFSSHVFEVVVVVPACLSVRRHGVHPIMWSAYIYVRRNL